MPTKLKFVKRFSDFVLALLLAISTSAVLLVPHAYATAGILDHRSIKMSTSAANATNVMYSVSFKVGTSGNVGGIVIDFCFDDPIPNDTCTAPTASFNTNKATLTVNNPVGIDGTFGVDSLSTAQTLIIDSGSPVSLTAGNTVSFDLGNGTTNGLSNPSSSNYNFYARIFTYTTNTNAQAYNTSTHNDGSPVDLGGIALEATAQLSLTAKVEEQLTLCLYTGANCGAGVTAQYLGDATNHILSSSITYANANAKLDASTNAANGMNIFASGTTLTSPQSFTIAAIGCPSACGGGSGSTPAAPYSSVTGSEQFGFCLYTNGLGSVTPSAPYNDAGCSGVTTGANTVGSTKFAFDTTSGTNMTTLGGMVIASSSGPSSTTTATLAYMANIAPTTRSGIYSTTQTFIGVGTF